MVKDGNLELFELLKREEPESCRVKKGLCLGMREELPTEKVRPEAPYTWDSGNMVPKEFGECFSTSLFVCLQFRRSYDGSCAPRRGSALCKLL
jgi:hypothetical protein